MNRLVSVSLVVLLTVATTALADERASDTDWRTFGWKQGQLVILPGRDPPVETLPVAAAINHKDFSSALKYLRTIDDTSPKVRAELAIAIAGHLDNDEPQAALKFARKVLHSAKVKNNSDSSPVRRLLNEIDVYETLHAVKLPWAERSPGHSFVPGKELVPARDLARAGKLEDARALLAPLRNAPPRVELLMAWQMAAFFQNRPDRDVFNTLLADLDQAMQSSVTRGDDEDRATVKQLDPLLKLVKQHEWASLTVPEESLLHFRAMLEPMRAYYWWFRQMGGVRPMAKQGFDEIIASMRERFPDAPIIRVYSGQQVPWGAELQLAPAPDNAPAWAVKQRELRARVDHIVRWWFRVRQQPDGQLGGGWEDDCETLRRFTQSALICDDSAVKAGINRLADGIWDRSGQIVNGFDRQMKDVEHASEMAADSSVLLALDYGNPHHFERFLQSCKTTDEVHFGTNDSGRRQYRAMVLNADGVSSSPQTAFDVMYCGRAMRPVAMVAWYSRNPRAVKLLSDWARTWSEAASRAADGKPTGVFPAAIQFGTEQLRGRNTWWDPGLGELYRWKPQDIDMVLAKILEAWRLTGDDTLLAGVKAQLDVMREAQRESLPQNPPVGSLDWATNQLHNHRWMAAWYRSYTGRDEYDYLAPGVSYWRFQTSTDFGALGNLHVGDLNAMRFNLPMLTTEVRGTDRINLMPWSLTGAMTGSHVPVTQTPAYAVTWKNVSRDFAALVGPHDNRSVKVWVYTCSEQVEQPDIRFWQLAEGRYRLRVLPDDNFDGEPDGDPLQTIEFDCIERLTQQNFSLPAQKLCLLEISQMKAFPPGKSLRPDLAVTSRDIELLDSPAVGDECRGTLTLHNIGAAEATELEVELQITPMASGKPYTIKRQAKAMAWPHDLTASRHTIPFTWTPQKSGEYRISATVTCSPKQAEICTFNNRTSRVVEVQ
jgi:hypothetical protein